MHSAKRDVAFLKSALLYAQYCDCNGYLSIRFITPDGKKIGLWAHNLRQGRIKVTTERAKILKKINFLWDVEKYLEEQRHLNKELKRKRKTFDEWLEIFDEWSQNGYIPADFVTPKGENVGRWAARIRFGRLTITKEQKEKLDERGFVWNVTDEIWKNYLKERRQSC